MYLDPRWPTFHNILSAYKSCRLHKPASTTQIRFETRLAANLIALLKEIHSGRYKPSPAKCFIVTEPKPREIFAAEFRDRVVHHLVVTQLEPAWDRRFIFSSFACRKGKGTHGAIKYLQAKVRSLSQGGLYPVWCLQLDVEKFFVSIDREILCDLLLQGAHHPRLRALIHAIYGHDARIGVRKSSSAEMFALIPTGKSWFEQEANRGLPIGNLTSQFGANAYLTALDHFIQRQLKPSAYMRYMDDLLLLDRDPLRLKTMVEPIDHWLQTNRRQRLNPSKTILTQLSDGIRYLGSELRQTSSPAQPLQANPEPLKKWKFIEALRKLEKEPTPFPERPHPLSPLLPNQKAERMLASINSRMGTLIHANSYRFRKKTLEKFLENTREHRGIPIELADRWTPFDVKKGYRSIKLR